MPKTFLAVIPRQVTLFGQEARPQPPMGVAYALNGVARAGWNPALLDLCAEGYATYQEDRQKGIRITGLEDDDALQRISQEHPDMIGVSLGISTDHDYTQRLIYHIRQEFPDVLVVVGGSHASLMNRRLFEGNDIERMDVDFVVTGRDLGSGESTIEALLHAQDGKCCLPDVPGLLFVDGRTVYQTPSVIITEQVVGSLPQARRDLFKKGDGKDIYSRINRSHTGPADAVPYAVMHTSRGCGAVCTFCHVAEEGYNRTLIGRSLANIVEELDILRDEGVQTISIEDDNFGGFHPHRTELAVRILQEIHAREFKGVYFPNGITLKSYLNNDHVLPRQLRAMADDGINVRNSLPIECGDDYTLKKIIHKPHTLEMVHSVLRELTSGGYVEHPHIELDAFFMVGITGYDGKKAVPESYASIETTFALARDVAGRGILVNVWWMKPNPGRPQYDLWREKFPDKPFYELQFLFPSGIWGTEEQELRLNERIRDINVEMAQLGVGSKRPIYPVYEH